MRYVCAIKIFLSSKKISAECWRLTELESMTNCPDAWYGGVTVWLGLGCRIFHARIFIPRKKVRGLNAPTNLILNSNSGACLPALCPYPASGKCVHIFWGALALFRPFSLTTVFAKVLTFSIFFIVLLFSFCGNVNIVPDCSKYWFEVTPSEA